MPPSDGLWASLWSIFWLMWEGQNHAGSATSGHGVLVVHGSRWTSDRSKPVSRIQFLPPGSGPNFHWLVIRVCMSDNPISPSWHFISKTNYGINWYQEWAHCCSRPVLLGESWKEPGTVRGKATEWVFRALMGCCGTWKWCWGRYRRSTWLGKFQRKLCESLKYSWACSVCALN